MTVFKGVALAFALAAASALVQAGVTGSSTAPTARLKTISSHVDSKGASLVIEATEPLPYVATRPDPLTVVVEFRNVDGQSVTKKIAAGSKSPIASVTVENADALGAPSSRVRIVLAEAVAHHVRSEKNQVIIDFDKGDGKSAPYVLPPASRRSSGAGQSLDAATPATGAADPISALEPADPCRPRRSAGSARGASSAAASPAALPSAAPPARSAALAAQAPAQAARDAAAGQQIHGHADEPDV